MTESQCNRKDPTICWSGTLVNSRPSAIRYASGDNQMNEAEFWHDYELIRGEVDKAIETFYTYLHIHKIANDSREIYRAMNRDSTFWIISLYSLQTTFFITMRRIFDDGKDAFSVHKFVSSALAHPEFFSKKALAERKSEGQEDPDWLEGYLRNVFEPGVSDLKKIKRQLSPFRRKFDEVYREIGTSVFAHTLIKDSEAVSKLFGKTNILDVENILYVLKDMLESLWQLYNNGRKLELGKTSRDYKDRIIKTTDSVLLKIRNSKMA